MPHTGIKLFGLLLRQIIRWLIRFYYSKIEITNRENIPTEGPVLLVANHANALIDPVMLGLVSGRPVLFFTKSTLFEIPVFGRILRMMGMIPAYRASDDRKQVKRNLGSLDDAAALLANGEIIGIFPEGRSHDELHLEQIRSGASRIALKAIAAGAKNLKIVPIGINFEKKEKFRSSVWVRVGEPIAVIDWVKEREENEAQQIRHLTESINERLREVVIHLSVAEWEPFLNDLEALCPAKFHPGQDPITGLKRRKWLADGINHFTSTDRRQIRTWGVALLRHRRELAAVGLTPASPVLRLSGLRFAALLCWRTLTLCFGVIPTVVGTVHHIVPFLLTRWLANRGAAKGRMTRAQAILGFGLPIYMAWYAFVWYWGQSYFLPRVATVWCLLMPFVGIYALNYWRQVIEAGSLWWHQILALIHRERLKQSRAEQQRLGNELLKLGDAYGEEHPAETKPPNTFSWWWFFRRTLRWTVWIGLLGFAILWLSVLTQNKAFPELVRQGPDLTKLSQPVLAAKIADDEETLKNIISGLQQLEKETLVMSQEFQNGKRSFYNQDDDDAIRRLVLSLITYRTELLRLLWDYQNHPDITDEKLRLRGFLLMLTSGATLYDYSYEFVAMFADNAQAVKKLNEGDVRWNIPPGLYDRVQANLQQTTHQKMLANGFEHFRRFQPLLEQNGLTKAEPYSAFATEIHNAESLLANAKSDVLRDSFLAALKQAKFLGKGAVYRGQAAVSTWVGDTRVRQPRAGQALIQPRQLIEMEQEAEPGDILFERQNWYLSRAFMPGYWAHAALYVGTVEDLIAMGLDQDPRVKPHWVKFAGLDEAGHKYVILEAVPSGVRMTTFEHCIGVADSAAMLRPRLTREQKKEAIAIAFSHLGKPYDFEFDFFSTDKLVCTELVYRAYDSVMDLPLVNVMGRQTLPPTEMVRKFATDRNKPDRQLDFVTFYDGHEREGAAEKSTAEELAKSVDRPSLTWLQKP